MNTLNHYDKNWAAKELEMLAKDRMGANHSHVHLAKLTEEPGWPDNYQVCQDGPVSRLASTTFGSEGSAGEIEEVVLSFQGIVYNLDIAPFKEKPTEKTNQARFLRQSITVGGLQTPTFGKVVENIAEIHALFSRATSRDEIAECGMMGEDGDETVLYASNRYFTPRKDAGSARGVKLTPDIDPHGYLARIGGENFVHTEENYVYYFERRKGVGAEEDSFVRCQPIKFRVGDIVEIQVSFVMLTLREGKKKTSMVLRSLLLLDGAVTQKCMVDNITKGAAAKTLNHGSLKRRVGYELKGPASSAKSMKAWKYNGGTKAHRGEEDGDDGVAQAGQKFSQMEIDDERGSGLD